MQDYCRPMITGMPGMGLSKPNGLLGATIVGLISALAVGAACAVDLAYDTRIHSFDFGPRGLPLFSVAILPGMASSALFFYTLVWTRTEARKLLYVLGASLGLVAWVTSLYLFHATLYVADDGSFNHRFVGTPVSSLTLRNGEKATFFAYYHYRIANQMTRTKDGKLENRGWGWNLYRFLLRPAWFLLGAALVGGLVLGGREYCEKCWEYRVSKALTSSSPEESEGVARELLEALQQRRPVEEMARRRKAYDGNPVVHFAVKRCPKCQGGTLVGRVWVNNQEDTSALQMWKFD